jgi:hypothetical protein
MSNYTTFAVNWSGKNALSDSDPAKVISGGDFHNEFTAIQTAVNTKADLNGSASESFSATTAAAGTDTTQVASTAFVKTAVGAVDLSTVYPVGAIFMTATTYADSAAVVSAIGGTTWVAFGAGKMPIGVDSTDTDFDTVEETGGTKTHTLTEAEMPAHKHHSGYGVNDTPRYGSATGLASARIDNSAHDYFSTEGPYGETVGSGTAHSIMNPYIAVYMWKRTA